MGSKHFATLSALLLGAAIAGCGGGSSSSGGPSYTLTVSKSGDGSGTVGGAGSGIDCGSACSASLASGTAVTLSAAAGGDSIFTGWGGACSGTAPTCTPAMTADQTVTAAFKLVGKVTITRQGFGSGTITPSADGVGCGAGCTAYDAGAKVTLSVKPNPDSAFAGWGGACSGKETECVLSASGALTVTASFDFVSGSKVCSLPSQFKWTSTAPIATPPSGSGLVSLKDFTAVPSGGQHVVYMTTHDAKTTWSSAYFTVASWADAAGATLNPTQSLTPKFNAVAPTLFYFTPDKVWVLAYQWCSAKFCYRTSPSIDQPTWSEEHALYKEGVTNSKWGPIDQTLICDSKKCHLFFGADNGSIYRSDMSIDDFPGTFSTATTIMTDTEDNLFEAVQVYSVQGTDQYLMIVEAKGHRGRFFRSFTATDLEGSWTPLAASEDEPFAGLSNVTFDGGNAWTKDISHGDLVRATADETMPIDACHLEFLYQGYDKTSQAVYDLLPYQPAVLTLQRQ